jgi:hypothetical protein
MRREKRAVSQAAAVGNEEPQVQPVLGRDVGFYSLTHGLLKPQKAIFPEFSCHNIKVYAIRRLPARPMYRDCRWLPSVARDHDVVPKSIAATA